MLITCSDAAFRKKLRENPDCARAHMEEACSGAQALARLASFPCEVLLLDRHLPDIHANDVADLVRRRYPSIEIRLVNSRGEDSTAERSAGNTQVVTATEAVYNSTPEKSIEDLASAEDFAEKKPAFDASLHDCLPGMIGGARSMQQVYRLARLVARRDTTVLINGETGTGKELVARGIHEISPRAKNPFVVVNCAAIPETLLEAELFGHARGAFTGAVQSRVGRIHVAQGGTLLLDEVGELPLSMQAKLLRFLQNGEVQRLGSSDVFQVDVRVICATNVRLLECVKQKQFRQDLYYRLAVFPIELPPLRERSEDMARLADQFLSDFCREAGVPPKRLAASAHALLRACPWPGNVRELQHAIERAFILAGEETQLLVEHFSHISNHAQFREI
jgi:transcriptional regulator with GAF, ATPase, and Fis domain